MKSLVFFMLLLLLGVQSFYAQNNCDFTLSGSVIDEHDSSKLAFATLFIIGEQRGVSANENGSYVLDKLCPKTYRIVVSHIGCESDTVEIKISSNMKFNFILEHHLEELQEVQVNASLNENTTNKSQLTEEKLNENTGKALSEMLSSINGVSTINTGANISKPVIGGFKNNRVQFINQGIQLQSQQWGDEHAPEIDPFAAEKYSVIKGAGSVKYAGGVLGGLVIVEPKALPVSPGISGKLNSLYATNNRLYNNSLMLEGKSKFLPKFAWRIQGSFKRSGNIKTPNYYQKNTGVSELNGSADLGYFEEKWNVRFFYSLFNSEIGIFTGAHIGNLTDLRNAIDRNVLRPEDQEGFSYEIRRPKQNIIHELTKIEANFYPADLGKVNFKLARQFNIREEFDRELPRNKELAALNIPEFSLSLESYSTQVNWSLPSSNKFQTDLGVSLVNQENSINSFRDFIPDYKQDVYSFYAIEKWQHKKTELELGFRIDQNNFRVNKIISREFEEFNNDFTNLTISLGFNYEFTKSQSLKGNLTYTERPPAINELYSSGLHHGSASLEFGNNELGKEKSSSFDLTYQLKKDKFQYEVYGYIRYIQDFIFLNPTGLDLTIRGAFPSYDWENTDALVRGIDQTIQYNLTSNFTIINSASFLWANNLDANNFLINMPSNRVETSLKYKKNFEERKRTITAKVGNQFVLKQNRFNEEQEFAVPPDSYSLFFTSFSFKKEFKNKQTIESIITIDNLLNEVYRDYLNRFRFFTDEQGRNITIRLNYNF